jgi:hypothetical protein
MPQEPDSRARPRRRTRLATRERRGRHLKLVTDLWIAELAGEDVVLRMPERSPPTARGPIGPAPATPA